jgi:hypothetical protein
MPFPIIPNSLLGTEYQYFYFPTYEVEIGRIMVPSQSWVKKRKEKNSS